MSRALIVRRYGKESDRGVNRRYADVQECGDRECQDTVDGVSAFLSACTVVCRRGKMLTLPLCTGRWAARGRAIERETRSRRRRQMVREQRNTRSKSL